MGDKGGSSPAFPKELLPLVNQIMQVMSTAQSTSAPFNTPSALTGLMDPNLQAMTQLRSLGSLGAASQAFGSDVFGTGLSALQSGLEGGFQGVSQDLLGDFESLLRPGAEQSKQFLQADVLENAASLGQTRSSGTVESLSRGFTGIESGVNQNIAGLVGQLTPAFLQAQLGGIGTALNLPAQMAGLLGGPIQEGIGITQFGQQLPVQAAGAAGGGIGALPIQAGTQGKSSADTAGQLGQMMTMLGSAYMNSGYCWTARAVYGPRNPRWFVVREFIRARTSPQFQAQYERTGEAAGITIAANPQIRADLRRIYDRVVGA